MRHKNIMVVVDGTDALAEKMHTILKETFGRKSFRTFAVPAPEILDQGTILKLPGSLEGTYRRTELRALYLMDKTPSAHAAIALRSGYHSLGNVVDQPYTLGVLVSVGEKRGFNRLDHVMRFVADHTKPGPRRASPKDFDANNAIILEWLVEGWRSWMYKHGGMRTYLHKR